MDTPTQFLLGATIGQACFGKSLGRKAAWWGGVGGTVPDLDVFVIPFIGRLGEQAFHRGPTHSLVFGFAAGPLLGYLVWRWYARQYTGETGSPGEPRLLKAWMGLFFLTIFTHPLLDIFTTYGTVLYWPFSWERVALDAIAIIDPAYTLWLVIALGAGRVFRHRPEVAMAAGCAALVISTCVLFYSLSLRHKAEEYVRTQLTREGTEAGQIHCYPTLFQPYLRRVVVRTEEEVRVGFVSMWKPRPIEWQHFTKAHDPLLDQLEATREGRTFLWFAMGQVSGRVTHNGDEVLVEIEDIRYGFPGPPKEGLWGIRAHFDKQGRLTGPVEYFDRVRGQRIGELLRDLFAATFPPDAPSQS